MRKTIVIAIREYLAAVRTKAFIIGLLMMPILMGGGTLIQLIFKKMEDAGEKHFAVIDRTPGQKLFDSLEVATRARNAPDSLEIYDPDTHEQTKPKFIVERIVPSENTPEAMERQRYDLSAQVLDGKYYGFLEIGGDVFHYSARRESLDVDPLFGRPHADKLPDPVRIRYQSRTPQYTAFSRWAEGILNEAIQAQRWADAKESRERIHAILQSVPLVAKGLTRRDPQTGEIQDAPASNQEAHLFVPIALVLMMFMMIMIGCTPLVASVLEEKTQRIAEVLLGSVHPFQLMMGKLVGMATVSLTMSSVYLGGGYYLANRYGFADLFTPQILAWFLVYLVLTVIMYGSIFIAVGAACTSTNETQTLLMPLIMIAVLPMMVIVPIVQEPNSSFATLMSFFPPSTPMVMIARQAVPPGIPWWQPLCGVLAVLAATTACVYAAGRIFRVGLLMVGKGARFGDLLKWVISG
jgi:ABC-type Na+ efflux pump permease subunit